MTIHMLNPADILHGKILIVDDQKANVILLEEMLRGAGYDAITTTMDPAQVCELHLIHRYDLILLDLLMPGMDGFQVMENLKEIETGGYLPVLVITAQPNHKVRALKAGAKDFVSKPFDFSEVLIRVHNMLEVRLLHQQTQQLYDRILAEQKVSERLLLNGMSPARAESWQARPVVTTDGYTGLITESYAEVSVVFSNITEFITFSEGASSEVLKSVLEDMSTRLDRIAAPDRERSRTIGDAYLAAMGLANTVIQRSIRASNMAMDMIEAVDRFNQHSGYKLKVSIGIDQGKRRRPYDL